MNGRRQAVALKWDPLTDAIPSVAARGAGDLADAIVRKARELGIPIREDRELVQILSLLDVGEGIPPEIETAIAEILAFIYWTHGRYEEVFGSPESGPAPA